MGGNFHADVASFTPSVTVGNWVLDANASNEIGLVKMISWGGRMVALPAAGYQTRWVRPTTIGSGAHTPQTPGSKGPGNDAATLLFGRYTGVPPLFPADPDGNLFAVDWNPFGGLGVVNMPIDEPWYVRNGFLTGQILCVNVVGTDANGSRYGVDWKE